MKPSTPVEARRPQTQEAVLARALHRDLYGDEHVEDWPTCCVWVESDVNQAVRLIGFMEGWHLSPDLSLPTSAPSRGPRISDVAAASVDDLEDRHFAVHALLAIDGQGMTDEELVERYCAIADGNGEYLPLFQHPKQTPQSIRTRRAELVRAGHVVDTGQTRPTKSGRQAVVWAAVGSAEVAA